MATCLVRVLCHSPGDDSHHSMGSASTAVPTPSPPSSNHHLCCLCLCLRDFCWVVPPSFADGGRMLWIYIFRQPFLSLVERLMKISCRQIFQTVKHSLLSILTDLSSVSHHQQHQTTATAAQVTLLVDPLTLEMKYRTVEGKKVSSGSSNSDAQFSSSTTPPPGSGSDSGRGGMALEAMASSAELSFRLSTT
jgi:hypothetical protein